MEVGIKITGLEEVKKSMLLAEEEMPFAVASSLSKTAVLVKARLIQEMKAVFDRPTPYTLNSLYVYPAKKDRLEAWVYMKDVTSKGTPAAKFLGPQIFGGSREKKRLERGMTSVGVLPSMMYAMPGAAAEIDQYGNWKSSQIIKMQSYFKAFGEVGYRSNITDKKKAKMAKGTKGVSYFALQRRRGKLQPGIYSKSSFGGSIRPIAIFTRTAQYKQRFLFFEVGEKEAKDKYPEVFDSVVNDLLVKAGLK